MQVKVISKDGKVIADYPILLGGLNYQMSAGEYIAAAKCSLIEDKLATKEELDKLQYVLQKESA